VTLRAAPPARVVAVAAGAEGDSMVGVTHDDVQRMRDQLFFEGPQRPRRLSRFWLLLVLSGVIASAGVVADSTATVIGAMIVAPLMTPILGIVLAVVLVDARNLARSIGLVALGAFVVVAIAFVLGHFVPYPVIASTNSQVASRVAPRIVDLVAALATGAVGSIALARSDVSDTLPGVAIAISLVPPLSVVGLTLESGAPEQAAGAALLFLSNVAAILASGVVVMALFRIARSAGTTGSPLLRRSSVALISVFLIAVIVPLRAATLRIDRHAVPVIEVQAVADRWASNAGWTVTGVASDGDAVLVNAQGPSPEPHVATLEHDLVAEGLGALDVRVSLTTRDYQRVTR